MTGPEHLDRYLDDFGRSLVAATTEQPRPQRLRRLGAAFAGGLAAGAIAIAFFAASGDSLDPVAEARTALAAPGEIVYLKTTTEVVRSDAGATFPAQTVEQWSALDPPRWRLVRAAGMHQEYAYGGGELRSYVGGADELTITRGFSDASTTAHVPSLLGKGRGDIAADLRSMFGAGDTIVDQGEQQLGERTVRRFVTELHDPGSLSSRIFVYDVDPQTFVPIQGTLTLTFGPPHGPPVEVVTRIRVDAYKRIALDARSARLLEIQTTPRTAVRVRSQR